MWSHIRYKGLYRLYKNSKSFWFEQEREELEAQRQAAQLEKLRLDKDGGKTAGTTEGGQTS
jgi:hypothetical protein